PVTIPGKGAVIRMGGIELYCSLSIGIGRGGPNPLLFIFAQIGGLPTTVVIFGAEFGLVSIELDFQGIGKLIPQAKIGTVPREDILFVLWGDRSGNATFAPIGKIQAIVEPIQAAAQGDRIVQASQIVVSIIFGPVCTHTAPKIARNPFPGALLGPDIDHGGSRIGSIEGTGRTFDDFYGLYVGRGQHPQVVFL